MKKTSQEILALIRARSRTTVAMNSDPNAPKITHGGYPAAATGPLNPVYGNVTITGGGGLGANTMGVGVGAGGGSLITGAAQVPMNGTYTTTIGSGMGIGQLKSTAVSTSPVLPNVTLIAHDENGKKVEMTLKPERSISAFEALHLIMMLMVYCDSPNSFCPFAFVKANNLERHFKFS